MTEKRFTWNSKEVVIDDNVTGNQLEVIDITEIDVLIDLLNELHEENEQLIQENKQLKEQLKSEHQMLENAILLERTRMGKNSLIQYKEAIM